ncbi:hypothetical protein [Mariniflexile sp.]
MKILGVCGYIASTPALGVGLESPQRRRSEDLEGKTRPAGERPNALNS